MSTIAGVFTETTLNKIRLWADQIMFDDRIKQQFVPQIEIINAIKRVQTAKFALSQSKTKDVDYEIMWPNFCNMNVESAVSCTFDGNKSSTNAQTYSNRAPNQVEWQEDENDYRDNEADMAVSIARNILMADKKLCEEYANYAVSILNTYKGINGLTGGKGNVVNTDTFIESNYWTPALMSYFNKVAIMNKFTNPIIVSGNNMYDAYWQTSIMAANPDGKGANNMMNFYNWYFDLINIDTINITDFTTYMLSTGSLTMANKYENPSTPEVVPDLFTRWSMESRNIPGFYIDIWRTASCTDHNRIIYKYKAWLTADLFVNPVGCELNNTGILAFQCGSAPS